MKCRRPPGNEVSGLSNGTGSIRFTPRLIYGALFGSSTTFITARDLSNPGYLAGRQGHMPYCQLFYHLVWSTKNREPLLTSEVETVIHNFLRTKAIGLGATVFALDGINDHVHIIVSVPPKIALSRFIGQIKAVASTKFNKSKPDHPPFFWQEEYGAFSFDAKRLPNYIAYVENQKKHHAQGTIIPILERTTNGFPKLVRDEPTIYTVEDAVWRRELETLLRYESAAEKSDSSDAVS
jgi:REP element-mobilizing transposase RayT